MEKQKSTSNDDYFGNVQSVSDEDYWSSVNQGFDFTDTNWRSSAENSNLSSLSVTMKKNDDLNQFDLLRYDGLSEIAENKSSSTDLFTSHILSEEEEKQAKQIVKSFNPLQFQFKDNFEKKPLTAVQTVKNIVIGLEYNLKTFKGKDEKIDLLKAAVKSHDGNAILVILMFLRSTLKKSIFQRVIGQFPDAVNMYLAYLHEDHEIDELNNMLLLLNKPEDAAIMKYDTAIMIQSSDRKIKMIQNCLDTHFQSGLVHNFFRESVLEHKMCIEDQNVLEDHRVSSEEAEIDTSKIFEELTGRKELLDSSVICSLIFCILYFYNVSKIAFISPINIKTRYKLSQKQYTWCALRAFAAANRWADVEDLFLSKSWLRSLKMRSCIGFVRVLEILSKRGAPPEVMKKYVSCLENQDMQLFFAKKYKCHSVVIEFMKKNRDRLGLIEYKGTLPPHSVDFCNATSVLNSKTINWKN